MFSLSDRHYTFQSAFPRTQEQFQGSSFKPLSLAYHPWVRAFQRVAPDGSNLPRLSFLMQHYHLYGQDPFPSPGPREELNDQTETIIESEDSASSSGDASESAEVEESTSSEVGSDLDVITKVSTSEIVSVGAIIAPLSYVLRPSCANHRRSSSSSTSSSISSSSSRSRRQIAATSHDIGLSAFHDIFTTSISPSDSTLFPFPENFHRGNRKKTRNHA